MLDVILIDDGPKALKSPEWEINHSCDKLNFLDGDEILYSKTDANYSKIYWARGRHLYLSKKIKVMETLLPDAKFYRVHNSYIVNLGKVREYLRTEGHSILENKIKVPVARSKKSSFLNKIWSR